jgi:hypothetical protein
LALANIRDADNLATAADMTQEMPFIINDGVLSTNQFEKVAALAIYPNPVNATFEILNSENVKLTAIEITDGLGRTVKIITPNNAQTQFQCADLQAGNYFVKLTSLNGTEVRKIIKN